MKEQNIMTVAGQPAVIYINNHPRPKTKRGLYH
ncbi:hypothetical protein PTE_03950 [Photorhabdus khanii NC19]|uniref:Uncharacterized protein n=1 Tax=Photorhabdus khanii NC19 TaxID=1004151 RepID=W3V0T7_9GAMM|nr:hypothetical protein PTE_03950 [Photorhabdus khanii NC19]